MARGTAFATLVVAIAGCGTDGPVAPTADIPVRLCVHADWRAYRNEGGRWMRLASVNDRMEFDATPRVAFAHASGDSITPSLAIDYATPAQLEATYPCSEDSRPMVTIPGRVRPLAAGEFAHLGMGDTTTLLQARDSAFYIRVRRTAGDLAVTHLPPYTPSWGARRVILRRAQVFDVGTAVALDFDAAEAFAPDWRTLRVDAGNAEMRTSFRTPTTGEVLLSGEIIGAPGDPVRSHDLPLAWIPASRLAAGDLHRVSIYDADRGIEAWYHAPRDLMLAVGPAAAVPTFTVEATSPRPRLRADVPAQPEYDASVVVSYSMSGGRFRVVRVTATREHFGGTPATWSLPIPELSGVDGFGTNYGLAPGALRWALTVTSAPGGVLRPSAPADGQVIRWALREGTR